MNNSYEPNFQINCPLRTIEREHHHSSNSTRSLALVTRQESRQVTPFLPFIGSQPRPRSQGRQDFEVVSGADLFVFPNNQTLEGPRETGSIHSLTSQFFLLILFLCAPPKAACLWSTSELPVQPAGALSEVLDKLHLCASSHAERDAYSYARRIPLRSAGYCRSLRAATTTNTPTTPETSTLLTSHLTHHRFIVIKQQRIQPRCLPATSSATVIARQRRRARA